MVPIRNCGGGKTVHQTPKHCRQMRSEVSSTKFSRVRRSSIRLNFAGFYALWLSRISGRGDQVKEYLVGTEVLGKNEGFDPRIDTGVRTEARRLRRKLAEYYQTEDLTGTIEIDLPKRKLSAGFSSSYRYNPAFSRATGPGMPPRLAKLSKRVMCSWQRPLFADRRTWVMFWLASHGTAPRAVASPEQPRSPCCRSRICRSDPEQEYFSDGMTDALITSLTGMNGLRVISRTSVLQYKRVKKPLPEIARQLGVDYIVEGTVLRAGDRVRITTQLIAARNERHLWADAFERDRGDVLLLQSELARTIAGQIDARIIPKEPSRPAAPDQFRRRGRLSQRQIQLGYQTAGLTREKRGLFRARYRQRAALCSWLMPAFPIRYLCCRDVTGPDRNDCSTRQGRPQRKPLRWMTV